MGRIVTLGIIALIASVRAAPAPQFMPLACLHMSPPPCPSVPPCPPVPPYPSVPPCPNPSQTPSPCEDGVEPTPNGDGEIKVQFQKSPILDRLRQIGFREVSIPGGSLFIYSNPDVFLQPPPILVKPAKQPPINPPAITVQPPSLPPVTPNPIVVKPPQLPPITPPPVMARPNPLPPIQPPPVVVRPPKPAKIQPAPISVTQPKPDPINPPQIVVRQPCPPTLQPSIIYISTSALQNQGLVPPGNSGSICPYAPPCPLSPC